MTELISSAPRGEFVTDRSLYPASSEEASSFPVIHRTHPSVNENIKRQLLYGGLAVAGWRAGCYQPGERAMVLVSLMGVILHTFLFLTLYWHLEIWELHFPGAFVRQLPFWLCPLESLGESSQLQTSALEPKAVAVASNAFSTKVAFITTVIEGHGSVSLLSKFYFCDPSLILTCRKSASSPSPFLLLVSAVGFREPLAQSAGAALRVKMKTLPKRKYSNKL